MTRSKHRLIRLWLTQIVYRRRRVYDGWAAPGSSASIRPSSIVAPWLARAVHRQTLTSPRPDLRSFRVYRRYTNSLGSDQDKYVAAGHRPTSMNASTPVVLSIIGVELLFVSVLAWPPNGAGLWRGHRRT
jgi:hypothetical protein